MTALAQQRPGRVLCVDDEPHLLRSLRWLLQKQFTVDIAGGGAEGLALVAQHGYDVVISDQRMPGMSGCDFLREVRRTSPHAMRILLTGYADIPAVMRSVNEGEVFRFISKPWQPTELLQTVGEAAGIARQHPAPDPGAEVGSGTLVDTEGENILVIDDDPGTVPLLREATSATQWLLQARTIAEAVAALDSAEVGIVLASVRVGGVDVTRLVKLLKQQQPDIVTVVYAGSTDAVDVVALINQAQVFRVLAKPLKATTLRLALAGAAMKRKQLKADVSARRRHTVQALEEAGRSSLADDIARAAAAAPLAANDPMVKAGFLQRLRGGLARVFGRA